MVLPWSSCRILLTGEAAEVDGVPQGIVGRLYVPETAQPALKHALTAFETRYGGSRPRGPRGACPGMPCHINPPPADELPGDARRSVSLLALGIQQAANSRGEGPAAATRGPMPRRPSPPLALRLLRRAPPRRRVAVHRLTAVLLRRRARCTHWRHPWGLAPQHEVGRDAGRRRCQLGGADACASLAGRCSPARPPAGALPPGNYFPL